MQLMQSPTHTCERIISKAFDVIESKFPFYDYGGRYSLNYAIQDIKLAYSQSHLNTIFASQLDFSRLSFRCAYLHRHFTCIAIATKRMWARFFNSNLTIRYWITAFASNISYNRPINVCCFGGGPGTDLIGFFLFLKTFNLPNLKINGVLFDKHTQWREIVEPLMRSFNEGCNNKIYDVKCEFFDIFTENLDVDVINKIRKADVISIVKFVSAVGYNRDITQKRIENLLRMVQVNALVFFMDNSSGGYFELMQKAAINQNLRLLGMDIRRKSRIPDGERKLITNSDLKLVCEPQKNAIVSAGIWLKI